MASKFTFLTPSYMGPGSFNELGNTVKELNADRVLLVCDPFLTELREKVEKILADQEIACVAFTGVVPEPTDTSIYEGLAVAKEFGNINGIIGMGGGSAMDTAKAINVLYNNPGDLWDYAAIGLNKATQPGCPLILIPSTSGTGSEATLSSVFTFTERNNQKGSLRQSNCTLAKAAIVDPEITASMPPALTISTGIDALCHASEALTIRNNPNPISNALAKEAIRIITKWLPIAHEDGSNMEAREMMGYAALMAGQAFAPTLCHIGHAFGHSFGAVLHKPHGMMVGQALPVVLNYLADTDSGMIREIGEAMGLVLPDYASPKSIGTAVSENIYAFYEKIQFPTLEELGCSLEDTLKAVPLVSKDGCYPFASKQPDEEEVTRLIKKMYIREI